MRILLRLIGGKNWSGGLRYVKNLTRALYFRYRNKVQIWGELSENNISELSDFSDIIPFFTGLAWVGKNRVGLNKGLYTRLKFLSISETQIDEYFDCTFPYSSIYISDPRCAIYWIPDFQHVLLPRMFSAQERMLRDTVFKEILGKRHVKVIFSSTNAYSDSKIYYPDYPAKGFILPFSSYVGEASGWQMGRNVFEKYHILGPYIICCNQMWRHKDHLGLIKAFAELQQTHPNLDLVLTGLESDYRFPGYVDEIRALISKYSITSRVKTLGYIDRGDQIALIKWARCLIQPSLFEGWSTVLEDARAIGARVIASDLPVHKEQSIPFVEYFRAGDTSDMAAKLRKVLDSSPRVSTSAIAKVAQLDSMRGLNNFAEKFISIID